jgi:hypothetical protein
MTAATMILGGIALYAAAGLGVGTAFVAAGVDRALSAPMSFTVGARLLLLPGAALLWPYVLSRWLLARARR